MGCFPDRAISQYKPLNEQDVLIKRAANPNKNIDSIYVPIQVSEVHTNSRPFNKAPRASPKKARAQPVSEERLQTGKFSRKQASVMKIDDDAKRRINRKRTTQHQIPVDRKKGKIFNSPPREHIITSVETPSESVKTSVLANFENNPSIFFVNMNEKDLDNIFNKAFSDKLRQDENRHRYSYRSVSPNRIHKQPSA